MNNTKICPLLSMAAHPINGPAKCPGERCAFSIYNTALSEQQCALLMIADKLEDIADR